MSTQQILFPAAVTAQLEILADMLLMGEIGLQDIPAPLVAFFHLGAASERTVLAPQIRDLEHECDLLYLAAAHPTERAADLQQRLNEHFELETNQFFTSPQRPAATAA